MKGKVHSPRVDTSAKLFLTSCQNWNVLQAVATLRLADISCGNVWVKLHIKLAGCLLQLDLPVVALEQCHVALT